MSARILRLDVKVLVLTFAMIGVLAAACAPAPTPTPKPTNPAPSMAYETPGVRKEFGDLSTVIEVPPFPFSGALAPAVASPLDGLYYKVIPLTITPTPCKRCAGYRLEGGAWTLYFDKGVYKVFLQQTGFESVGSFTVSGNKLALFNDPYCEEDMSMRGDYAWELDAQGSLRITTIQDACSYKLRGQNLTSGAWARVPDTAEGRANLCQVVAGTVGPGEEWKKPPFCK